ncbi:MAG: retropepsin-like domain-containing protein [Candidatus Eremiobacteraeota bacterium]|nr:retropepsin-like domain-containing protein [Candidatus Eremiobacteraeota bacterium]
MSRRFLLAILVVTAAAFAVQGPCALCTYPAAAASSNLPSVQVIFKKHRDSLGRLPSLVAHWTGSITEDGQTARYDITATRDGRYRRLYVLPMASQAEGNNGPLDWEQDANGNVRTMPAEHHTSMDARLVRLNDFTFDAATSAVLGSSNLDGHKVFSVSAPLHGDTAIVYYDAVTWLIDGVDVGSQTVRYRSYRRFAGVAVPIDIQETTASKSLAITVDNVDFAPTTVSAFEPPQQREPLFPKGSTRVGVNFDAPHGLIVCAVKVNGHPERFLVDSGSTTSIIDLDAAQRLGLPQGGHSKVEGATTFVGTVARIDSFEMAGISFEPLYVQAVPLRLPSKIAHEGIDGVLGYDLFSALVVRISYKNAHLELSLPSGFTYGGNGSIVRADLAKHIPIIVASVGKDHTGSFSIDTGSTAKLVLYKHFADANSIDFLNPTEHDIGIFQEFIYDPEDFSPSTASAAGGEFPTRHAVLDRLNLGTFSLPDLPTEIVMREEGAFASDSSTDGIVGGGSLAMFDAVFLDYAESRIILEK